MYYWYGSCPKEDILMCDKLHRLCYTFYGQRVVCEDKMCLVRFGLGGTHDANASA